MKNILVSLLMIFSGAHGQTVFDQWFTGETMRIDYILAGDYLETHAYVHSLQKEKEWFGSKIHFNDPYVNGEYFIEIIDSASQNCIFTKSFNTLYGEWQTTAEAKTMEKAFQQSVYFPCPREPFTFMLYKRTGEGEDRVLNQTGINPESFLIPYETFVPEFKEVIWKGDPSSVVDIAFVAEGYRECDSVKFISDVQRFCDYLFTVSPFRERQNAFNVRAVFSFSADTGTDNPGIEDWRRTAAGTGFFTFGSERYLTTPEYWKLCDLVQNVPADQIVVLVNTDKYGGGGIYNFYSVVTSDHPLSEIVFVHEFGHAFAGLGDEYYDSEVAYESFYPQNREPVEPNLTTLIDFNSKWKDMLHKDTPIPTPPIEKYRDKVGVFEGGGYVAKGVYRPQMECRMKSNTSEKFCKVCQRALNQVIDHYSEY